MFDINISLKWSIWDKKNEVNLATLQITVVCWVKKKNSHVIFGLRKYSSYGTYTRGILLTENRNQFSRGYIFVTVTRNALSVMVY